MKNDKIYAAAAIAILVVAGAGIVYSLQNPNNSVEGTTMTDALGRTVEVPDDIDSIFCMNAGSLRLVSYFSSVEKVRGLEATGTFNELDDQTYYLVYNEFFSSLPRIGTDAESIIAHNPDIIITSDTSLENVETLQTKTKIAVFAVNPGFEIGDEYYEQLQDLGKIFKEEARADELVNGTKSLINDISSKVISVNGNKAYACGMFYYGGAAFTKGTGNYQPFNLSYIYNVMPAASNGEPYSVTKETVISYNPDVIFIDSIEIDSIISQINGDISLYNSITAVSTGEVYSTMVYKCYYNNWENQLVNAFYVAEILNGDLYDWDFGTKADEVMELYYPGMGVTYAMIAEVQGGCGVVDLKN